MSVRTLSLLAPDSIPEVRAGDALAPMILEAFRRERVSIFEDDILVVAQKIVSKSEGRTRRLEDVVPSARAQEIAAVVGKDPRYVELVLQESREVVRLKPGVLIVEDRRGFVVANAGIDASNVPSRCEGDTVLLLPEDPDASAARLRASLTGVLGFTIGVIINDSWGRAWRLGTIGTALGVAGVPGLLDLRGQPDREGRPLMTTEVGFADEIAAAA